MAPPGSAVGAILARLFAPPRGRGGNAAAGGCQMTSRIRYHKPLHDFGLRVTGPDVRVDSVVTEPPYPIEPEGPHQHPAAPAPALRPWGAVRVHPSAADRAPRRPITGPRAMRAFRHPARTAVRRRSVHTLLTPCVFTRSPPRVPGAERAACLRLVPTATAARLRRHCRRATVPAYASS